jgi:hypothetical protein
MDCASAAAPWSCMRRDGCIVAPSGLGSMICAASGTGGIGSSTNVSLVLGNIATRVGVTIGAGGALGRGDSIGELFDGADGAAAEALRAADRIDARFHGGASCDARATFWVRYAATEVKVNRKVVIHVIAVRTTAVVKAIAARGFPIRSSKRRSASGWKAGFLSANGIKAAAYGVVRCADRSKCGRKAGQFRWDGAGWRPLSNKAAASRSRVRQPPVETLSLARAAPARVAEPFRHIHATGRA